MSGALGVPPSPGDSRRPVDRVAWDDRSHQPHRIRKAERYAEYPRSVPAHARLLGIWLWTLPGVLARYRRLTRDLYPAGHEIPPGFGVGAGGDPATLDRELAEVTEMGARSVLVRAPVWDLDRLPACRAFLTEARSRGLTTVVAVLQDRKAITDPGFRRGTLETIFGELAPATSVFEIGHAWNRLKWGVLTHREYLRFFHEAEDVRRGFPAVRLAGPAVIDFEYYYTAGALMDGANAARVDIASALLYVDRRGAPENRQMGFDLARKIALLRAYVDRSPSRGSPLWITEMNWPLRVGGGYAPTSMIEAVDEERQADYLVRYYLIALATGLVEQVFWWQTAAHGYGLVDDLEGGWRRRPAWHAFRALAGLLPGSRLVSAEITPSHWAFTFRREDRLVTAAWSLGKEAEYRPQRQITELLSRDASPLSIPAGAVRLSPSPVYLIGPAA